MVQPRQFIEPGLGLSTYFDFGARLFSMQWPPYGAHLPRPLMIIDIMFFCWPFPFKQLFFLSSIAFKNI